MGPAPSKPGRGRRLDHNGNHNKKVPKLASTAVGDELEPGDSHDESDEDYNSDFDKEPTTANSTDGYADHNEDVDPEVPLTELIPTTLVYGVVNYINSNHDKRIELPDGEEMADLEKFTMKKLGWWFNGYASNQCETGDECVSDMGSTHSVSSASFSEESDSEEFEGVDRTTSWTIVDEHQGAQLLYAKYRSGPGDTFANIFEIIAENFDWDNPEIELDAFCNLCDQKLVGKYALGNHIASSIHIEKMSSLGGFTVIKKEVIEGDIFECVASQNSESVNEVSNENISACAESDMIDGGNGDSNKEPQEEEKLSGEKKSEKRKRINERSFETSESDREAVDIPLPGTRSEINATTMLESQPSGSQPSEHSFPSSSSRLHKRPKLSSSNSSTDLSELDEPEFREKLALLNEGKWSRDMEKRWKRMEVEKAKFLVSFSERQKLMFEAPERHARYDEEWEAFWEKRSEEVKKLGLNADTHDYVPEWTVFWRKRIEELLTKESEENINEIKRKHGVDIDVLKKLRCEQESITPAPNVTLTLKQSSPVKLPPDTLTWTNTPMKLKVPESTDSDLSATKGMSVGSDSTKRLASVKDEALTQPPFTTTENIDVSSNADSESIASYDFDGYDIPQVLTLMDSVEDDLTRLRRQRRRFAPKIQEYLKKAGEMELKKRHSAKKLLDNEQFVAVLATLRDEYMDLIRENDAPRDLLRSLNHSVYALDAMEESSQFQMYRFKLQSGEASVSLDGNIAPDPEVVTVEPVAAKAPLTTEEGIAKLLTVFLLKNGKSDISDSELRYVVKRMTTSEPPPEAESQSASSSAPVPIRETNSGAFSVPSMSQLRIDPDGHPRQAPVGDMYYRRTSNVASSSAGSSLPHPPANYMRSSEDDGTRGRGRARARGWGRRGGNERNVMSSQIGRAPFPSGGRGRGRGMNPSYPP